MNRKYGRCVDLGLGWIHVKTVFEHGLQDRNDEAVEKVFS